MILDIHTPEDLLDLLDMCESVAYDYRYAVPMQRIGESYVAQGAAMLAHLWQHAEAKWDSLPDAHPIERATYIEPTYPRNRG